MQKQYLILGIIAAILIGGGVFFVNGQEKKNSAPQNTASVKEEVHSEQTNENAQATNYVTYSTESLKQAQEKGRAVLYFWAIWCPTCKALDAELKEQGGELPSDVTILQVNYDTEKELKKRYSITQQHTLVQIDKDGSEIHKWIGGGIETIKQQLK